MLPASPILIVLLIVRQGLTAAPCLPVEGTHIRVSDLAAVHPAFGRLPVETVIAPTPNPGATRTFRPEELARLSQKFGLPAIVGFACFTYKVQPLSGEILKASLSRELDLSPDAIQVAGQSQWPVPEGPIRFPNGKLMRPTSDGSIVFRGLVQYAGSRSVPVWVKVRLSRARKRTVAVQDLAAGIPIQAGQVRMETIVDSVSGGREETLVDAVGMAPRRPIARGTELTGTMLTAPRIVAAGDRVQVVVSAGGARLRFSALAESGGKLGQDILVKNPANGRRFKAKVESPERVTVNTGRAHAK
jgi:flagella basal body P-ring formation protein FlgA